jgi:hypothetical protein
MMKVTMKISKTLNIKGKNVRVDAGTVDYMLPTLADFGLAEPDSIGADGFPVYNDVQAQFLQDCVTSRIEGIVRNIAKVEGDTPESLELVLVRELPTTLNEYLEGAGGSRFFEVRKQAVELFNAWVAKLALPQPAKDKLSGLFSNAQGLAWQSSETKQRFGARFSAFIESLTDDQQASVAQYLRTVTAALSTETAEQF